MRILKRIGIFTSLEYIILIIAAAYNYHLYAGSKVYGNAASRILLAVGPIFNIGVPYKDLYELVPPGYLVIISSWVSLFGVSMVSFRFLHVLFLLLNGIFLLLILQKLFKNRLLEFFIFLSIVITVYSRIIQTDIFAIDFIATTFVLGGLTALFYIKRLTLRLTIAASLFALASQVKDTYLFSVLCLFPYYLRELLKKDKKPFVKLIILSAIVPISIVLLLIGYLYFNGALEAYISLIRDKLGFAQQLNLKRVLGTYFELFELVEEWFLKVPNLFWGLVILNLVIFFEEHKFKLKKSLLKYGRAIFANYGESFGGKAAVVVILILSMFYGLITYGISSGTTRIFMVTAVYIVIGLLLSKPFELILRIQKSVFVKALLIFTLIAIFIPKESEFNYFDYPVRRDYPFTIEREVMQKVDKEECILHVHGWEVAATYIYSQRQPCSKYFLTNELFNIRRPGVKEEYKNHLSQNPPAVIFYSELGADLDIERFEKEVISLRSVIKNCYVADPKYIDYMDHYFAEMTLYWPQKNMSKEELKNCWRDNSAPQALL